MRRTPTRREFFDLADLKTPPVAIEAVTGIDAIFALERAANGLALLSPCARHRTRLAALVTDLETWLRANHAKFSGNTQSQRLEPTRSGGRPPPPRSRGSDLDE